MYHICRFSLALLIKNSFVITSSYGSILVQRAQSQTMKYLNVAEKNDAAKNIALHLSRGTSKRREGLSQYNKIYEFETEIMGEKYQMTMTSVSGHLLALEFANSYKNWQSCNPLTLFDAPVIKYCPENYEKIKKTLEREVRSCQGLIIWTDCDREGENIGFEIIEVCSAVRNDLRIYRAKFSEITSVSVHRALQNLEQPNKNISNAVDVRQELDLRIGAAFTRFQTLRLQKVFPSKLAHSIISYGSCQFPTLGFVVERYRAVNDFVVETFWKIKVNHTMNNLSVDFAWDRVRLFDQEACEVLHDICLENPIAKVVNMKTKPKSKWRPLPLDTVELEKLASRKLKINAKETMRLAEKLYTQGFISYPRTETNEFPKEMNLRQLVEQHTGDPKWGGFAQRILDGRGPTPRQGNKSDKAHPPIHPTKYTNNLSANEQRLYEFIVRSFLACCSEDAQGQETTITIVLAEETFSTSGLIVTARNYLDVYPYDKWSSKEIHVYQNGQTFNPTSIELVEGNTSPPNLLTEADLIALMEKHGIGTDATHADHIETIKSRSYVALADGVHFVPGLLGMGLVEGYDAMGLNLARPHLRAHLEADLKAISEGTKRPEIALAEQVAKYKDAFIMVTAEANKIDNALAERFSEQPNEYVPTTDTLPMATVLKCPKCGSDMVLKHKKSKADELFISCVSYPSCRNAVWLPAFVKSLQVLEETCPTCGPNYNMAKFEWRNNLISHLYPPPYTGCIGGCDTTFLEYLHINLAWVKPSTSNQSVPSYNRPMFENRTNNTRIRAQAQTIIGNMPARNINTIRPPRQIAPRGNSDRVQNTAPIRMPAPRAVSDSEDNKVLCACNKQAILLTVRKQNANFGKKFYKCPLMRENGGCDFFLWAPETENTVQNHYETPRGSNWGSSPPAGTSTSTSTSEPSRGWGVAPSFNMTEHQQSAPVPNENKVMCNCGLPAKRIIVQKAGSNQGRPFYGCSKDSNARCNFFLWADSGTNGFLQSATNVGSNSTARGRGHGRGGSGRGSGYSTDTGGARNRKCGICRQEGHTRSRCPNNQ